MVGITMKTITFTRDRYILHYVDNLLRICLLLGLISKRGDRQSYNMARRRADDAWDLLGDISVTINKLWTQKNT
jgi:hypothetical protein